MKPLHTFRLCALIIISLTMLSLIYPKNGVTILGQKLDFTNFRDFFYLEQIIYADISSIISDTVTVKIEEEEMVELIPDSLSIQHTKASLKIFRGFYKKLAQAKDKELIRILHYGDSQVEADRISGTLREKLQQQFGGSGVGIVPVTEISRARSNVFIDADNWQCTEVTSRNQKETGQCGLWGNIFTAESPSIQASIKVKANSAAPELQRDITNVKLLCKGDLVCSVKSGDLYSESIHIEEPDTFSVVLLQPGDTAFSGISFDFTAHENMQLYGVALDGENGVTVDNVSLRGSSGIEFTRMDSALLKQQIKELNTGMIILQFGVNVVPNLVKDYSYYQKQFSSQLAMFRKLVPDVAILVIGVSDMSRKEKGEYVSYPNITKIRNAMKQAAFDNNCAYWDLYEVMGGQNSMPSWVKSKPALANKDYTHFNNRGAEIIGTKLYNALLEDYKRLNKKKKQKAIALKK